MSLQYFEVFCGNSLVTWHSLQGLGKEVAVVFWACVVIDWLYCVGAAMVVGSRIVFDGTRCYDSKEMRSVQTAFTLTPI